MDINILEDIYLSLVALHEVSDKYLALLRPLMGELPIKDFVEIFEDHLAPCNCNVSGKECRRAKVSKIRFNLLNCNRLLVQLELIVRIAI